MRKAVQAACLLLCWTLLSFVSAEPGKTDVVADVLGCKSDPCIIKFSPGGFVVKFEEAAQAIIEGARSRVIIDGDCYSACTLLLDRIENKGCLTVWARLYFHRGITSSVRGYYIPPDGNIAKSTPLLSFKRFDVDYHMPSVTGWIKNIGGLPQDGQFVEMPTTLAHSVWQTCELPPTPLPRPRPKAKKAAAHAVHFAAHGLY